MIPSKATQPIVAIRLKLKSLSSKIGGIFGFSVQYTAAFKFSQFVFVIKLYQK